jgi:hypothetical protein
LPSSNFFPVLSSFIVKTCPSHSHLCTLITLTISGDLISFNGYVLNTVLKNVYREQDIISEIRCGRWLGHVERMSEERIVKNMFKNTPERKRVCWKAKRDG